MVHWQYYILTFGKMTNDKITNENQSKSTILQNRLNEKNIEESLPMHGDHNILHDEKG